MASVEPVSGGWRVTWREGGRGAKQLHTPVYATKPEAMAALEMIEGRLAAGRPLRRGVLLPIGQVLQRWKSSRLNCDEPNDEWTTENSVGRARKHLEAMGWKNTADITAAEVQRWRDKTANTRRAGVILASILRWARDFAEQPVDDRALAALRPPRGKWRRERRELPTVEAVTAAYALAAKVNANVAGMVHVAVIYGWRATTLAKLSVGDIRGDVATTQVKGGRTVDVVIMPPTVEMLGRLTDGRASGDPIFLDPRSGARWALNGSRSFPQWCRDNLGFSYYDFKYFAVTNLLDVLDDHVAQSVTTHLTPGQLRRYARTNEERGRAAIAQVMAATTGTPWNTGTNRSTQAHLGKSKKPTTSKEAQPDDSVLY